MTTNAVHEADCIFCRIVAGEADASIVFRDDVVTAFMDVAPLVSGHTLVVPNSHATDLLDLPEATAGHMAAVARRIALRFGDAGIQAEGVNLFLAHGKAAGQTVFHAHMHVIPRRSGDGFSVSSSFLKRSRPDRNALNSQAKALADAVAPI